MGFSAIPPFRVALLEQERKVVGEKIIITKNIGKAKIKNEKRPCQQ